MQKNLRKLLLATLLAASMLLTACGKSEPEESPAVESAPGETAELRTDAEAETPEPTADAAANADSYDAVLQKYEAYLRELRDHPDAYGVWNPMTEAGECSIEYYYEPESFGYTFMDLNGDGQEELLIGRSRDENEYHNGIGNILDLYTIKDGQLVHVYSSGARFMLALCADGTLRKLSTGSAFDATWEYYALRDGELALIEGVRYDENAADEANGAEPYFYSTTDVHQTAERSVISEAEANQITKEKHILQHIEYTPFAL